MVTMIEGSRASQNKSVVENVSDPGVHSVERAPRNAQGRSSARELEHEAVRSLDSVSPSLAGKLALRTWMQVPRHDPSAEARRKLDTARTFKVEVPGSVVLCYEWGHDAAEKVLICHGWEESAAAALAMVDRIVEAGLSAVAFDAPAHGRSTGSGSSVRRFALAVEEIWRHHGPFTAIVAHSIGASAAVMALQKERGWQPRLALVSAMSDPSLSLASFSQAVGLSAAAHRALEEEVCLELGRPFEECGFRWTSTGREAPVLFVHDRLDKVVPYTQVSVSRSYFRNSFLSSTSGLGHRRIFADDAVASEIVSFIMDDDLDKRPRERQVVRSRL